MSRPTAPHRKRKPASSTSLDDILSSVHTLATTTASAPQRRRHAHTDDTASQYMLAKQPAHHPSHQHAQPHAQKPLLELCRNAECAGRGLAPAYETDSAHGDRICTYCGAVQNARSIENLEEEHRTFRDDDGKSQSRKRAEVQRGGRTGTVVGNADLAQAQTIAGGGSVDKQRKEVEVLEGRVQRLAGRMQLSRAVVDKTNHLAEQLVRSQAEHALRCGQDKGGSKCRLGKRPKHKTLVAAALINVTKRDEKTDLQFQELAEVCREADDSCASVKDLEVRQVFLLVSDLLRYGDAEREVPLPDGTVEKGRGKYPCAADPLYRFEANIAAAATDAVDGEDGSAAAAAAAVLQHRSLLPRIIDALGLPYLVQRRSEAALNFWLERGLRAIKPQTAAACAVRYAFERSREQVRQGEKASGGTHVNLTWEQLSEVAGVNAKTLKDVYEELGQPDFDDDQ